jgi:hypothetical protein
MRLRESHGQVEHSLSPDHRDPGHLHLRRAAPFEGARDANEQEKERLMDLIFILIIVALYAATHWLTWALSRLGGVE